MIAMNGLVRRRHGLVAVALLVFCATAVAQQEEPGLQGEPSAIEDARAMVERMGGLELWAALEQLHFVHEWDIVNRPQRYLEHEILDLADARSHVTMDSEDDHRTRVYSPEHGYWSINDGEFTAGSDEDLANAVARAPFSIYRLARAIGRNDPGLTIRHGTLESIPPVPALEFERDGQVGGWVVLNARKEPMIWATTQYVYVFGPLRRFGNLWIPDWATTSDGLVRYEMVSLDGSNRPPDSGLFRVPEAHAGSP